MLCLVKLMCVLFEYCEVNFFLLIIIMECFVDVMVWFNVVIVFGDMVVCFNYFIDENIDFLYCWLVDLDVLVKRICFMMLMFLILVGQVKVKGQLGEMVKCLEDEDKRIVDLVRMFFIELLIKDNVVYNYFVDMFLLLSVDQRIDEESFRRIVRFLLGFVEKVCFFGRGEYEGVMMLMSKKQDKYVKQLVDKFVVRLLRCDIEWQWNDVVFVLGLLQYKNEEIVKVVFEGFRVVKGVV